MVSYGPVDILSLFQIEHGKAIVMLYVAIAIVITEREQNRLKIALRDSTDVHFVVNLSGAIIADNKPPGKPGEQRPEKTYISRVYYSGEGDEEDMKQIDMGPIKIFLTPISHGKLAVVNNGIGAGFRVCYKCGYSELRDYNKKKRSRNHTTAWGEKCNGKLEGPFALGHEFETDILKVSFSGYRDNREGFWISLLYALLEGGSEALSTMYQGELDM